MEEKLEAEFSVSEDGSPWKKIATTKLIRSAERPKLSDEAAIDIPEEAMKDLLNFHIDPEQISGISHATDNAGRRYQMIWHLAGS